MRGDFSRWTAQNAVEQHYKAVLMQQGRPQTDADWNEQVAINAFQMETTRAHVIGPSGTPKGGGGFEIRSGPGGFRIGAGRYYVDGAQFDNNDDTTYDAQGGDVGVPPLSDVGGNGTPVIVFLETENRAITALDDPRLADPALGGIDTAVRVQDSWRVGVEELRLTNAQRAALIAAVACGEAPNLPGWDGSTGAMSARTLPAGDLPDDSDCEIPPEAGYLSQENQLYRVQIIRGGSRAQSRFVWSRENGSILAALARNSDGEFFLQGDRDDEAFQFKTGDWVQVFDAADSYNMRPGTLHRLTLTGGIASFAPAVDDFNTMVRPQVRRWDHGGASDLGLQLSTTPTELERGIEVSFTNGTYVEGDWWVFEARAATGNIVWPQHPQDDPTDPMTPMGKGRKRAALALATIQGGTLSAITDLRAEFPHLTCLQAEDVGFDDTACQMGAETVQEAIEALCARTSSGLCTVVVSNAFELETAVSNLAQGQSVRICLRAGQFALSNTLEFARLGHVTVMGNGPQTVVSVSTGEAAFAFTDCASVRVVDMSLNGGPTGQAGRLITRSRLGAISAINCNDVSLERLRLQCRAGLDRRAACVSTRNTSGSPRILVRDCMMRVGQSQIGVQIIGAGRAIVQDNTIAPSRLSGPRVRDRFANDPVLVARVRKSLISFSPRPGHSGMLQVYDERAGEGREVSFDTLFGQRTSSTFSAQGRRNTVTAQVQGTLAQRLSRELELNRASRITTQQEMRQHLINAVSEAIRNPGGRARIGSRLTRLVNVNVPNQSYIAQGITIAGADVDEAQVTGNRIEGAMDGIRIAASSDADPVPATWRTVLPPNTVRRARISGNIISLRPLADSVEAHGIYLGHVDSVSVSENDLTGPNTDLSEKNPMPHFGLYQHGHRGARLTVTENTARRLYTGFAVVPGGIDPVEGVGIWRLRDNAPRGCVIPYVVSNDVDVF